MIFRVATTATFRRIIWQVIVTWSATRKCEYINKKIDDNKLNTLTTISRANMRWADKSTIPIPSAQLAEKLIDGRLYEKTEL